MAKPGNSIIDLTHALGPEIPSWDGDCGFALSLAVDYKDCPGPDFFRVQKITAKAGMGTHIDAPAHCFSGKATIDALPLQDLITDCVVIKVHEVADEHYIAMPDAIEKFERAHGRIRAGSFVIFHTGWDRH